jgi:hypothetical protein
MKSDVADASIALSMSAMGLISDRLLTRRCSGSGRFTSRPFSLRRRHRRCGRSKLGVQQPRRLSVTRARSGRFPQARGGSAETHGVAASVGATDEERVEDAVEVTWSIPHPASGWIKSIYSLQSQLLTDTNDHSTIRRRSPSLSTRSDQTLFCRADILAVRA